MQLIINLPEREETLTTIRQGWASAIADPYWKGIEGRFESNAFGQIIMSPPPPFSHSDLAYRIAEKVKRHLGGHATTECPILTIDGVKVADAVWFTDDRYQSVRKQAAVEIAPEICVEVLSPSNTEAEMRHKRELYFDQGAVECWTLHQDGTMRFYTANDRENPQTKSTLCPEFPAEMSD